MANYVPSDVCVGTWEISGADDLCAQNEALTQESYVAENININGAPLNIFKLLGVHEQSNGSLLNQGVLLSSAPSPGYPLSNINNSGSWRSVQASSSVAGTAFIGIDFGINTQSNGQSEYAPVQPNLVGVGAITFTQADTALNFARQVRVDITDGKITQIPVPSFIGVGNGQLSFLKIGPNAVAATLTLTAISSTQFSVFVKPVVGALQNLGTLIVGITFRSVYGEMLVSNGSTPFSTGDSFTLTLNYDWKRAGVYNLVQSSSAVTLNLQTTLLAKAVRIVPTLFTGSGNWEVLTFDVLESAPTDINNIQDLFFQENRDRDYSTNPIAIKAQYSINDSITDLSKFGFNILDQYSFSLSFSTMVQALGRPIVTGDIIEVIPELQYDQNLRPVRKFLEVTDTGWASQGFSTAWKPTLYRFAAQQVLPSQETRDIFGTIDTQKYLVADNILGDLGIGEQVDTSPLTVVEQTSANAKAAVPEVGSDDQITTVGQPMPVAIPSANPKGQPAANIGAGKQGIYIEDALPPAGSQYKEGYTLPLAVDSTDGDWFRLYYPQEVNIPPRLYRFSVVKNRWVFMETDRRGEYTSAKPSVHKILMSESKQSIRNKT